MSQEDERLLVKSEAARLLGVTPASVRALEIAGQLPAIKTPTGVRLFREADVLALAERREQQRGHKPQGEEVTA